MLVDPVKLICLNDPLNVGVAEPVDKLMFRRFVVVAPELLPKLNVLVTFDNVLIFDVPVNVKFVAVAIDSTVAAAMLYVRETDPDVPNAIARVLVLVEDRIPVVSVKLFRSSVPLTSVVVELVPVVSASCRVAVSPGALIVRALINRPFEVRVPLPTIVKIVEVYRPPLARVKP